MEKIKTISIDVSTGEQIVEYKEVEPIEPIIEPTPEQQILDLKQMLTDTDYQAIKYAEGWLTDEEYAPIKEQRQEWREEINRLENEEVYIDGQ